MHLFSKSVFLNRKCGLHLAESFDTVKYTTNDAESTLRSHVIHTLCDSCAIIMKIYYMYAIFHVKVSGLHNSHIYCIYY